MITRIEIDGFKTFERFAVNLSPLVVILGPNASGKSNLFDAIRLLSRLASTDLRTAVKGLRGEPRELFRRHHDGGPGTHMHFAVEVLLNPEVGDPWGATVQIKHSRVRYVVEIQLRTDERGIERLVVSKEEARPILRKDDAWHPRDRLPSPQFRQAFMRYNRLKPWLSTERTEDASAFNIHQDGHAGRKRSAEAAEATVLSSITSAEFPHLYALREELRSWRFLQLDPVLLRRPSATTASEILEPDASNLPTVLARIKAETSSDANPNGVLAEIAADLGSLIPGVIDLEVEEDQRNREYKVNIGMRDGPPFSSQVVSDGTLRILALLALLRDPKHRGVVCFEEPENGVSPFRLRAMISRLRELVTDPLAAQVSRDEPLTQMILNSHSPVVLSSLEPSEMLFADVVSTIDPQTGTLGRKTRVRAVQPSDQGELALAENPGETVSRFEVARYLSTVDLSG